MRKRYMAAGLAVFVLFCCGGCGFIGDAATHVQSIQLPPGDLYSAEYYHAASPEEVKNKIRGRSLSEAQYEYKSVSEPPLGDPFIGGLARFFTAPFVPVLYISRTAVNPLGVAAHSTPYPEVMVLLLEAGAGQREERERSGYIMDQVKRFLRRHSDEKSFTLLGSYLPEESCERFLCYFGEIPGTKLSAFDDYLVSFPGTDLNCRDKDGRTPLQMAVKGDSQEQVRWLLHKGANPELPFSDGNKPIVYAAKDRETSVGPLLEYGAKVAPLTSGEREAVQKALQYVLGFYVDSSDEEKLAGKIAALMRTANQKGLQELGALCSLPGKDRRDKLKQMLY